MSRDSDDSDGEYTQILYGVTGEIARVTLNRPHLRNAQSLQLLDELRAAFERAAEDDSVKVVILDGAGPSFSSGHDLGSADDEADREHRGIDGSTATRYRLYQKKHLEIALELRRCPKPTIAQVSGFCIYGGFILASAMDLIIASDDAQFLPAQLALFSAPWDLGVRGAKEVLYRGRFMSAVEAADRRLVSHVVPRESLESRTTAIAEEIAAAHTLFELRMLKESMNAAQDGMGYEAAMRQGYLYYFLETAERRDRIGVPAFAERPRLGGVDHAIQKLKGERKVEDAPSPALGHSRGVIVPSQETPHHVGLATPENPATFDQVPLMAGLTRRSKTILASAQLCQAFEHGTLLDVTFPDITARRDPGAQVLEGFLSAALVDALIGTVLRYDSATLQTLNYGIDRSRFVRPAFVGDEVWTDFTVLSVRPKGDAHLVSYRCDLKSGDGDGSLFAIIQWTVHVSLRGAGRDVTTRQED